MALPGHTSNKLQNLDYDKITFQNVQFSLITFNGDILFELPLFLLIAHKFSQM
jgi:hypothetical protein